MAQKSSKSRGNKKDYRSNGAARNAKRGNRRDDERSAGSDRSDARDRRFGPENDMSWYSRNPNLLVAAAQFPYPNRPGMDINLAKTGNTWNYNLPGILTLDWVPSVGQSSLATDPASILGNEIYARVRKVYSGSLDADAPDYVIYVLALDSIFAYIAWLKRVYRVLNAYTPENYILPDRVLGSMGLAPQVVNTLRANKEQVWGVINTLVLMSRKFTCPGSLDIINRHYWMSDNIYTDDATINSQFYMFNLRGVYQYTTIADTNGVQVPSLTFKPLPQFANSAMNPTQMLNFGTQLINALAEWDDSYTINGYLRRAYEGENFFIVDELPHDAAFNPVYEPEVLLQIENSMTLPGTGDIVWTGSATTYNFDITQDVGANAIVSKPYYQVDQTTDPNFTTANGMNPYISQRTGAPGVIENTIATRLKGYVASTAADSSGSGMTNVYIGCATEIPLGWRCLPDVALTSANLMTYMNDYIPQVVSISMPSTLTLDQAKAIIATLRDVGELEAFDWHPFVAAVAASGDITFFGDVHNLTVITNQDLEKLHRVCLFSEFNSFGMQ